MFSQVLSFCSGEGVGISGPMSGEGGEEVDIPGPMSGGRGKCGYYRSHVCGGLGPHSLLLMTSDDHPRCHIWRGPATDIWWSSQVPCVGVPLLQTSGGYHWRPV